MRRTLYLMFVMCIIGCGQTKPFTVVAPLPDPETVGQHGYVAFYGIEINRPFGNDVTAVKAVTYVPKGDRRAVTTEPSAMFASPGAGKITIPGLLKIGEAAAYRPHETDVHISQSGGGAYQSQRSEQGQGQSQGQGQEQGQGQGQKQGQGFEAKIENLSDSKRHHR